MGTRGSIVDAGNKDIRDKVRLEFGRDPSLDVDKWTPEMRARGEELLNQDDPANFQKAQLSLAYQQLGFNMQASQQQFELSERQVEIAERQQAMAEEQYAYWKKNFKPVEERVVKESMMGLDPSYFADRAGSDVGASFDKARGIQVRNMERAGIDASSPRFQALDQDLMIARSAAEAGARNQARNVVADVNYARKLNAAQLGRSIPGQAASISSTAAGTYGAAAGTMRGAADTANQGFSAAIGANQYAANFGLNAHQFKSQMALQEQLRQDQQDAALIGGGLNLIGTGATAKIVLKCLPEGTPVETPSGERAWESLRVGDQVYAEDGQTVVQVLHKHEYLEVENQPGRWREVHFDNGRFVRCCDMHRIDGKPAGEIEEGDAVGSLQVVRIVREIDGVKRSGDLLTSSPSGGYRIGGAPVNTMIPELAALTAKMMEAVR